MALALDDRRLVPAGVHDASLEDVREHFGGFQKSDRRMKLFAKLRDFLAAVKKAECGNWVLLDGSFVMGCVDEPEDIDLVLVLPEAWDLTADLKPYQYNLVSKRRVKKEYGIEIFPVRPGSVEEQKWVAFFSQVNVKWCQQFGWPADATKGLLRVPI